MDRKNRVKSEREGSRGLQYTCPSVLLPRPLIRCGINCIMTPPRRLRSVLRWRMAYPVSGTEMAYGVRY
eukprot:709839-Rhodomonas_salina.1